MIQQPRRHNNKVGFAEDAPPPDTAPVTAQRTTAADPGRVGIAQRTVASYQNYRAAEQAVGQLSQAQFPVDRTAIVGRGLTLEEKITGTVSAASAAGRTAATGAAVGALIGWLLGLFNLVDPLVAAIWLALNGALLGTVAGGLVGLVAYAATRGRRRFTATPIIRADHYDIVVDGEVADRAAHLLRSAPSAEPQGAAHGG